MCREIHSEIEICLQASHFPPWNLALKVETATGITGLSPWPLQKKQWSFCKFLVGIERSI
jgi:hypothetical protein